MPEPDFDQLTVDLATRAGRGDILPHIKDALRQVWNARGAADMAAIDTTDPLPDPASDFGNIARAIRSLDR
jgi:hypothetical protein